MGQKSPKQFAQDFVYNSSQKQRLQSQKDSSVKQQASEQEVNNIVNRLSTTQNQHYSKEIQNENIPNFNHQYESQNRGAISDYTKLSEQIKQNFKTKQEGRSFIVDQKPDLLLSPQKYQQPNRDTSNFTNSKSQIDHSNRLVQEREVFEEKRQYLVEKKLQEEIQKCPFTPAINRDSSYSYNPSRFYDHQQQAQQMYNQKQEFIKENIEKSIQENIKEKPQISQKSKVLAQQKRRKTGQNNSLIDRLYTSKGTNNTCQTVHTQQEEEPHYVQQQPSLRPFSPQISPKSQLMKRGDSKIQDILYQDAKRRNKEQQVSQTQKKSQSMTQFTKISDNQETVRATISRFIKEFQTAIYEVLKFKDEDSFLTYIDMVDIMKILNFLSSDQYSTSTAYNVQNNPTYLAQAVWKQLNGSEKKLILSRNLLIFLLAVYNIYVPQELIPLNRKNVNQMYFFEQQPDQIPNALSKDEVNDKNLRNTNNDPTIKNKYNTQQLQINHQKNVPNTNQPLYQLPRMIGFYDQYDNLLINEENTYEIHKNYHILYLNRLSQEKGTGHHRKQSRPVDEHQNFNFIPKISNTTQQLALNKRERVLEHIKQNEPKQVKIDLNFVLCYQQTQTEIDKQIVKQQLEEEQMQECTFHPQTQDYNKVKKLLSPQKNRYKQNSNNNNNNEIEIDEYFSEEKNQKNKGIYPQPLGVQRTKELYKLARPQNQKKDRVKGDIEYEKECDECTFQPDISSLPQRPQTNANNVTTKDIQKSINRIKNARINSCLVNKQKLTGNTQNQKKIEKQIQQVQTEVERNSHKHKHEKSKAKVYTNKKKSKDMFGSPNEIFDYKLQNQDSSMTKKSDKDEVNELLKQQQLQQQQQQQQQQKQNQLLAQQKHFQNIQNQNFALPTNQNVEERPEQVAEKQSSQQNQSIQHNNFRQKTLEDDRIPLLFVDVNIEEGKTARIVVYEGDKSETLANKFAEYHSLDSSMKAKLKDLLDMQINSLLTKIDEENASQTESDENNEDKDF